MTAYRFSKFLWLQTLFGKDEAIKGLELENHTAAQVAKILKDNNKVDDVDFVPGGRVILLFTALEQQAARVEYEAAKAAGIDVSDVQWLSKDEVQSVGAFIAATASMC